MNRAITVIVGSILCIVTVLSVALIFYGIREAIRDIRSKHE